MALSNPLTQAAFADLFPVADVRFDAVFAQESSLTGGGERLYADRAPALQHATVTSVPVLHAEAEGLVALANSRLGGLKTILLHNYRLPYPSSDPTGSIFGASAPAISTITNRSQISFTSFPGSYVVPLGTWFGLVFGTSRYYLGQFCEARTATGGGGVSSVEIFPPLPASVVTPTVVTVKKPPAKFRIVPNSVRVSMVDQASRFSTVTFEADQTYSA